MTTLLRVDGPLWWPSFELTACHDDADVLSASATYVFFLDYLDDVIDTMSYIFFIHAIL